MSNSEIDLIRETAKDFAKKNILPFVKNWDEEEYFPRELFKQMGEMGFMGVLVSEKYGGAAMSYDEYVAIIDEISQICPAIGLSVAAHNSLCTQHINYFANDSQKEKYLPPLATGKYIGAWGLTEAVTGSDAMNMSTIATKVYGGWMLQGSKIFITHGNSAEVAVILARTGKKNDSKGISAFIVERGFKGLQKGPKHSKMGMRASETTEMIFDQCFVPDENLLGKEGEGFIQAMKILDGGRISIAALSLGTAKGAYGHALEYSKVRNQFGKRIFDFQGISFKLAEAITNITASETLIKKAIESLVDKVDTTKYTAMCKYFASETAVSVCNEAVQILGGYGFTKDFPVEKFYRDVKLCTIGEGTTEIQKIVISRKI